MRAGWPSRCGSRAGGRRPADPWPRGAGGRPAWARGPAPARYRIRPARARPAQRGEHVRAVDLAQQRRPAVRRALVTGPARRGPLPRRGPLAPRHAGWGARRYGRAAGCRRLHGSPLARAAGRPWPGWPRAARYASIFNEYSFICPPTTRRHKQPGQPGDHCREVYQTRNPRATAGPAAVASDPAGAGPADSPERDMSRPAIRHTAVPGRRPGPSPGHAGPARCADPGGP